MFYVNTDEWLKINGLYQNNLSLSSRNTCSFYLIDLANSVNFLLRSSHDNMLNKFLGPVCDICLIWMQVSTEILSSTITSLKFTTIAYCAATYNYYYAINVQIHKKNMYLYIYCEFSHNSPLLVMGLSQSTT